MGATGRLVGLGATATALAFGAVLFVAGPARAASLTVTTAADVVADDGLCSLREAITAANTDTASGTAPGECSAGSGADEITFAVPGPIVLTTTSPTGLEISDHLTISGGGVTIDGDGGDRDPVLRISNAIVSLNDLVITGGDHVGSGGGVVVQGGRLTVRGSTITGNAAEAGGGVAIFGGTVSIFTSTISDNVASSPGGGIHVAGGFLTVVQSTVSGNTAKFGGGLHAEGGTTLVSNSTISGNTATALGGGIHARGGTVNLRLLTVTDNTSLRGAGVFVETTTSFAASVVADNTDGGDIDHKPTGGDIPVVSEGDNVLGDGDGLDNFGETDLTGVESALLGPLTDNGGPTLTHFPLPGSPVIDKLVSRFGMAYERDQRGVRRPAGARDAGAVEAIAFCAGRATTVSIAAGQTPTTGRDVILGTEGPDIINGGSGNDVICGLGGDDQIDGGPGNDRIFGDDGNDRIIGNDGRDVLRGGAGDDHIDGGKGLDRISGNAGRDTLLGGNGKDRLDGHAGPDRLVGGGGNDRLLGGGGNDVLDGRVGTDFCVEGETLIRCEFGFIP